MVSHPALYVLFCIVVVLLTMFMSRYLKSLATSRSISGYDSKVLLEKNWEYLAWVEGGSYRVMQVWFAALVQQGVLSADPKSPVTFHINKSNFVAHENLPSLASAVEALPDTSVNRLFLTKFWRPSLQQLQNDVQTHGLAAVVPRERLALARIMQVSLFALHMFVLWNLQAPWQAWTGTLLLWFCFLPKILFHDIVPLPASFVQSHAEAHYSNLPPLSPSSKDQDVLLSIALNGTKDLWMTDWDFLILPEGAAREFFGMSLENSGSR